MLARGAGADDDEAFELHAEHLLAQAVVHRVFGAQLLDNPFEGLLPFGGKRQPQRFGGAVEQQSVARNLAVVAEDAVKITVEQQRKAVAVGTDTADAVQGRQRDDLPGGEPHRNVIDLQRQAALPHPEEFIESVPARQLRFAEIAAQDEVALQRGAECYIHIPKITPATGISARSAGYFPPRRNIPSGHDFGTYQLLLCNYQYY